MNIIKKTLSALLSATIISSTLIGGFGATATENKPSEQKFSNSIFERYKKDKNKDTNKTTKSKSYVEGEAVVMLKDTGIVSTGASLKESIGVSDQIVVDSVENFSDKRDGFSVATVSSDKLSTEEMIDRLNKSDDVLIAEPNYIGKTMSITKDTYSDFQWALDNKGQNGGKENEDLNPQDLWAKPDKTTKETVVAVIDTGVDYTHEELKNKMWVNPYQKSLRGVYGLDFTGDNSDMTPLDNNGHGTHCAGIIAAQSNNNTGISGVSKNTKIMALKVLDSDGYGDIENFVAAYNYIFRAMKLGVNVVAINNSWGMEEDSKILTELIDKVGKLGAVSVCAAGNGSTDYGEDISYEDMHDMEDDFDDFLESSSPVGNKPNINKDVPQGFYYNYPAMSDSKYIITVGATGEDGDIADYSDYGKDTVELAAPGSDILSSVSYNNFLPNIYTDTDSKCSAYLTKDFSAKEGKLRIGDGDIEVKETSSDYFSDTTGDKTSLQVNINNVSEQECYSVEIPYTAEPGEQNSYFSMMLKIKNLPKTDEFLALFGALNQVIISDFPADKEVKESDITSQNIAYLNFTGNDWVHLTGKVPNKEGGARKLVLTFVNYGLGDYTLFFDNIGISKGKAKEEDSFGKYDYYSGTSMSTPAVVGAIALLMEKDDTLTSQQAMDKIKHSVKQNDSLMDKTIYGGALDLSRLECPVPHIDDVKLVNGKPLVFGSGLENSKVLVGGKVVSADYNYKNKSFTINDNSILNKTSEITVENNYGKSTKTAVLVKGSAYTEMGISKGAFESFTNNVSDGKNIYVVYEDGSVNKYTPNSKNILKFTKDYDSLKQLKKHFKNFTNGVDSEFVAYSPVYSGGYIYFVVDCNLKTVSMNYENPSVVYASQSALVKLNVSNGKMSYTAINSTLLHPTVAVYNGKPYLVGGYDTSTNSLSKAMYKYSSGKWTKLCSLPSARAYGKCVQVGTRLVYTMGTDGTDNIPKNLIYNGKSWTESKASIKTLAKNTVEIADQKFTSYECSVDLISGGLLYTGILFEGIGDTVKYTVSSDSFASLNKAFHTDSINHIKGVVVNNKYYGTFYDVRDVKESDYPSDFGDFGDFGFDDWDDEEDEDEDEPVKTVTAVNATFPVSSGMYTIKANAPHGKVTGTGLYMPGSKVTLKASANKGFKVKSIYVNGKTFNTNKVTFTATKSLTVKVNYISYVTKIKLNKKSKTLKIGEKFTLKATVTPKAATNKAVTWSTSSKKIATVNSKGVVKAKAKGNCKIKATAKDGSKVSVTCKIKVVKK